jgi:CPA2 family monovalent cation:H+ antiporter-2
MHGVAQLLFAAAGAYLLARLLRLPPTPLLLVGGIVLARIAGPSDETLEQALFLGAAFLLFVVGLELDPRRIRAQRRASMQVGFVQFLVLAGLGFVAARWMGLGLTESGYVALALTASSTLVGVRLLQRRRQMFEPFGRLVLGVLPLQDVLVLLAIPVLTHLEEGWMPVVVDTAAVGLLGLLALAVRRWVAPLFLRVADEPELVLLAALSLLFAFLGIGRLLELPLVVGAFLAGASLARFPVNGVVRSELAPVGDFFAAVFFTALGALVRVPSGTELAQAAVLALLVLVVTPPLVAVLASRAGFTSRPAVEAGLLLAQTSEISLVVGLSGMLQGDIPESLFVVLALVTLVTMLLTPLLATDEIAWRLATLRPGQRETEGPVPSGHVLLVGTGATGMPLLEDLILTGHSTVVVDDDPAVVARLREAGVQAVRGEASDREVLRRAGADRARVVSSTIRRVRDNAALLQVARGVPVLVRVFDAGEADWVREHGGEPVLYSDAAAAGLLEWFQSERARLSARLSEPEGT